MVAACFAEITNLASGKNPSTAGLVRDGGCRKDPLAEIHAVAKRARLLSGRQK
jgi:hypothetical protein